MNSKLICHSIFIAIQEMLKSGYLKSAYSIGKAFTRKRKLTFEKMLYFLLNQSKKSLNLNIVEFQEDFPILDFPDISKQAVSKSRKGIDHQLFAELLRISVKKYYEHIEKEKSWHGYRILAVDGTQLQLPQTARNLCEFGGSANQSDNHMAMASASLLYDVLNDIIIDAAINKFGFSERTFAKQHLETMTEYPISEKTVVVFDRGYPSGDMMQQLYEHNLFFVIRQKKSCIALKSVNRNDQIIPYCPKYVKCRENKVRVLQIPLETGETEILLTNLMEPEITLEMFKELYFLRWPIEGKYLELKTRFELEEFSGNCPESIRQDFYINIFFSNLVAILKAEADETIVKDTYSDNKKHHYQCTRSFLIGRLKKHVPRILCGMEDTVNYLDQILKQAKKVRSQVRPHRKCKRTRKPTRRKHHNNRKRCL